MARLRKQYEGIMREIEEHVRQCGGAGVLQYSTKIQWRDLNVTAPELRDYVIAQPLFERRSVEATPNSILNRTMPTDSFGRTVELHDEMSWVEAAIIDRIRILKRLRET